MASRVGCVLNVYETQSSAPSSSSIPVCTIQFCILYRYQLKIPSNEGAVIVVEDVITPEQWVTSRIPIVFPLSVWRELYLSDILKHLNLEAGVHNFLKGKIVKAALSLAERHGNKGFAMVAKVGILKAEIMGKEEADRIASGLIDIGCHGGSL